MTEDISLCLPNKLILSNFLPLEKHQLSRCLDSTSLLHG